MTLFGLREVAVVTCRYKGKDNAITLAWHILTSFEPQLYAISVGKSRFSHNMIKQSGVFCVNFMPASLKQAILHCGTVSGKRHDKFAETGLEKVECRSIDCCRIGQTLAWAECKVIKAVETGDHTLFVGKVLKSKELKGGKRLYQSGSTFTAL